MSERESLIYGWSVGLTIAAAVILWVALAALVGQLAVSRNHRKFHWVITALLLSPGFALILLYSRPRRDPQALEDSPSGTLVSEGGVVFAICPECREMIKPQVLVCRHCGRDVAAALKALALQDAKAVKARIDAENAVATETRERLLTMADLRRAKRIALVRSFVRSPLRISVAVISVSAIVFGLSIPLGAISRPADITSAELVKDPECPALRVGFNGLGDMFRSESDLVTLQRRTQAGNDLFVARLMRPKGLTSLEFRLGTGVCLWREAVMTKDSRGDLGLTLIVTSTISGRRNSDVKKEVWLPWAG